MTEDAKREVRVRLQIELEDAESELAHLRENALAAVDSLYETANKLRHNARLEPSRGDFSMESDLRDRLTPDQIAKHVPSDAVIRMISELRQSRQKVFNLKERRDQLAGK